MAKKEIKGFWNRFGDQFLNKIKKGHLTLTYSSGKSVQYGNGKPPFCAVKLNRSDLFKRLFLYGDIGFCESYMDGDFEVDDLTAFVQIGLINAQALQTTSDHEKKWGLYNAMPFFNRIQNLWRKNTLTQAQKNIRSHYDLSNEFFALMLDDTMSYSSAVFRNANDTLTMAQQHKIKTLAQKLGINEQSRVLEIGSGWGSMSAYLAQEIGCEVVTLTLSKAQQNYCEKRFEKEGISNVKVLLQDYRDAHKDIFGKFDAIIAVEMFEAVGRTYFSTFFKQCQSLLKSSGLLVLQVITIPDQRYTAYSKDTDFIRKYIFPGGHLPSLKSMLDVTQRYTRFNLLSLEDFTDHYAKTLHLWQDSFNTHIEKVKKLGFDNYFIRMWRAYLSYCEAGFLTRNINLVQLVFSRDQNMGLNDKAL